MIRIEFDDNPSYQLYTWLHYFNTCLSSHFDSISWRPQAVLRYLYDGCCHRFTDVWNRWHIYTFNLMVKYSCTVFRQWLERM